MCWFSFFFEFSDILSGFHVYFELLGTIYSELTTPKKFRYLSDFNSKNQTDSEHKGTKSKPNLDSIGS